MKLSRCLPALFLLNFCTFACTSQNIISEVTGTDIYPKDIRVGAEQTEVYYPWIKGKKIAIVANQTSMIQKTHLVDSLVNAGFDVKKVLCPEHGFRGDAEAGEVIGNTTDKKTKLPVISLYGKNKKPTAEDLKDVDVVLFDIQDVGARFYTYISTMHYVMEACAENNKLFIVLDRPNPNGYYVDGPVLEKEFTSFVGMHPVPIVHGMTIAEYACMINGEKWLNNDIQCPLKYVTVVNYKHADFYQLPDKPSPNLPGMESIYLYPTLCLFEGTCISVGRGTERPFEIIGSPLLDSTGFSFTPRSIPGMSKNPPYEGKLCHGYDFKNYSANYIKGYGKLYLFPLLELYRQLNGKTEFFNSFFNSLAGTASLKQQIISGATEEDIRKSWQPELEKFKKIRKKYLLYTDFE
ncbi:MAG TPA: DUF1343 domain-containing protein [Bacteroidales bacterium]|mgnify:CR=1 FL=1|nr:DUF1343 domain-containing protein [Bacteroidales bacterium]